MMYRFNNLNCKVLDKIHDSNISKLWKLAHKYIDKHNSINNGFNLRYNRESKYKNIDMIT